MILKKYTKYIGKTAIGTQEGITPKERFQRIFLDAYENIEKSPHVIDEIFISNLVHRVLSQAEYRTIDDREAGFFPQKIVTDHKTYTMNQGTYTNINVDEKLIKRSKEIGITVNNTSLTGASNVHIYVPTFYMTSPNEIEDLYFFQVPIKTAASFQFPINFTRLTIGLEAEIAGTGQEVEVRLFYLPL